MRNSNVRWKTTPQVDFLFGNAPPLACTTLNLSTGTAHGNERAGNESSDALHYNTSTDRPITSSGTEVDARNTANFRTTGYCGQQDMAHTPLVRREFIHYYAKMLERVPAEQPCVTDSDSIVCTGNSSQHKQPQSQDSCRETGHSMTDTTTRAKMAGAETEADGAPASAAVGVKKEECIDDTNDTAMESKGGIRQFSGTAANATSSSLSTFYARGILVQVGDPSTHGGGEAQYTPWEFYIVHDTRDASCYIPALLALHNHASALHANGHSEQPDPLRMRDSHHGSDRHDSYYSHAAYEDADEDDAISQDAHHRPRAFSRHSSLFGRRGDCLLLYTRLAASFTGIHAGMVVGVAGEPFQRSAQGVLTGVVVHRFVLPHDPFLPWTLHRCVQRSNMRTLMHGSKHGTPTHYDSDDDKAGVKGHRGTYTGMLYSQSQSHSSSSSSVRIHFCSGPFPRQDIPALLRSAIVQAIQRDADLLIIGGPLIQPFGEKEKDLLPTLGATFAELLDFYIDTMEETLESYYSSNASTSSSSALLLPSSGVPAQKRIKILVVPHREDVTQTPVLPTTMYALQDTPDIMLRSSPCRIAIAGVHVGVCNEDVVSRMQSAMVERGQVWAGRMERVVQALVRSRLYCPIYRLPAHHVDVRHLGKLHLDYAPVGNELLQLPSSPASAPALPNTEAAGAGGGSDATTATPSARVPAEVPSPSTSTPARLAHKGEQNRTARWRLVSDLHKQDMATVCEWMAQEARLSHNGNTMKRERSDCGDEYDGNSCHAGATRNSRSDGSHVKLPKLTNGQQGGIDANRTSGDDADAAAESPSMDDDSTRKVKTIYVSAAQNDMSSSSGAANEPNATQDTSYTTSKAIHDASDVTESVDAEYDAAETVVETSNSGTYTPDISLAERDIEVEFMPHILFLPSVQSPFAHLTQARVPRYLQSQTSPVWNTSHTNEHNRTGMDECGVLVINQGVWPSQGAGPFEMRVAEVTIPCAEAVARAGVSDSGADAGVTCSILRLSA